MKSILLILLLAITPLSSAFSYEIFEIDEDYFLESDPNVCLIESELENLSRYETLTKQSIDDWQNKLKEFTGNSKAWNIHYSFVSSTQDIEIDSLNCDIFIIFYDDPDNSDGDLGATFQTTLGHALIEIYNLTFSDIELISTISHELGHSFGLDHYVTDQPELIQKWDE